jgi:hypothetical protein
MNRAKARRMTATPKSRRGAKVTIDKEFKRIAERNLRKDRELLERLAKI